jgi:UPF0716 protein FxsA
LYQTNEPIFSYIYRPTSFRNILIDKIGGKSWSFKYCSLIFLTAIIGYIFCKTSRNTNIKSGMVNLYQNKMPIYEMMSGASIAIAAFY